MNKVSIKDLKKAQIELKRAGYSVTGWARARGHSYWTVVRVLRGEVGIIKGGPKSQAVINDLEKEGFLNPGDKQKEAA